MKVCRDVIRKDLVILTFAIGMLMHVDIYIHSLQGMEPWIYICLTFWT